MNPIPIVLLVEDSLDDTYFFHRALTKSSIACDFKHVSDGGAAVRFLEQAALNPEKLPDFIFLDLKMPVLSGFDVLEWLRRQTFGDAPVVFVLSGSNQEADRHRAAQLGATDYLVKPVSAEDLIKRLQGFKAAVS